MSKAILKSLALLGALAVSGGAYASTVSVSYQGSGPFTGPVATGYVNGLTVDSVANPDKTVSGVQAGAFSLKNNATLENFIAFCVDITKTLAAGPVTYTIGDLADLTVDATRQSNIQKLFNTAYSTLVIGDNTESAGFQMALWELLYETVGAEGNLSGGNFTVAGTGSGSHNQGDDARSFAEDLIANLSSATETASYDLTFLHSADRQNLITATVSPVPVPAAGLLLLAGLAGLGVVARRRKDA